MKKYTLLKLISILIITSTFSGCDSSPHDSKHSVDINYQENQYPKAILPINLFVTDLHDSSISVLEARRRNLVGKNLSVEGFIGTRRDPFSANRASFILGDDTIETCDQILGDNCPTPWDACCEDRNKIRERILSIQILDNNHSLIHGNLNGVGGLKPGLKIKVLGTVDTHSLPSAMVLNATKIQIL